MAGTGLPTRPVAKSQQFAAKYCNAKNGGNLRNPEGLGVLQNQQKGNLHEEVFIGRCSGGRHLVTGLCA